MRIAHVGDPARLGSILSETHRAMGHDAELWTLDRFRLPPGLRRLELRGYDVLHLHSFRLLPYALETLIPGYTKVVIHHHGSDVRGKGEPFGARWAHHRFCTAETVAWTQAEYLPNPVESWSLMQTKDQGHVAHGEGEPGKAGTRFVEEACGTLGLELFGKSTHRHEWLWSMAAASVVIGKVTRWCGGPGVTNLEAMALGKPTMCFMSTQVAKMLPDCPVVPVTPESLTTVLRAVMSSADLRAELGEKGRAYVAKYHDPVKIAERCLEVYHQ